MRVNYLLLAMAHQQLANGSSAEDWYNKAVEWLENSDVRWFNVPNQMIYDIYLEASELMGIELREF